LLVAEMAGEAGMEERAVQRRFKAAAGMTPAEYVRHLCVGGVLDLLAFTRRLVDRIAWSVGYADAGAFRKLVSPSDRPVAPRLSPVRFDAGIADRSGMIGATIRQVIAAAAMVRDNGQWSAEDFFRPCVDSGRVRSSSAQEAAVGPAKKEMTNACDGVRKGDRGQRKGHDAFAPA
jgi:AraC-like DNA-binding protein